MRKYRSRIVASALALIMSLSVAITPVASYAEELSRESIQIQQEESAAQVEQEVVREEPAAQESEPEKSADTIETSEDVDVPEDSDSLVEEIEEAEESEEALMQQETLEDTAQEVEAEGEEAKNTETEEEKAVLTLQLTSSDPDLVTDAIDVIPDEYNLIVEIESKDKSSNEYVFVDTEVLMKETNEKIRVVLNSLTKENKDLLIQAIQENFKKKMEDGNLYHSIIFSNKDFVDADKWNITDGSGYDSLLCWAGQTSNMLWASGWAQDIVNPLTHKKFASEDEIFTYFASYFEDNGGNACYAIPWFFDAIYEKDNTIEEDSWAKRTTEGENKYNEGVDLGPGNQQPGLKTEIYAGNMIKVVDICEDKIGDIEQLAEILKYGMAGTSIQFWQNGKSTGGHAITIVGILTDESKSGLDKYVALILSDPDDSALDLGIVKPDNPDQVTIEKSRRPNQYQLCYLDIVTVDNKSYWVLKDYAENFDTVILGSICLENKKDANLEKITETEGTKDTFANPDLISNWLRVVDETGEEMRGYWEGDPILIQLQFMNQGNIDLRREDSPSGQIINRLDIYKDGKLWNQLYDPINIDDPVKALSELAFQTNLSDYFNFTPGNYTVKLILNVPYGNYDRIPEAYFLNNEIAVTEFFVQAIDQPEENPEQENPFHRKDKEVSTFRVIPIFVNNENPEDIRFYIYDKRVKDSTFYLDVNRSADSFVSVSFDGKEVDAKNYKIDIINDGNFHIVFEKSFMDALSAGEHQIDVRMSNQSMPYSMKIQVIE